MQATQVMPKQKRDKSHKAPKKQKLLVEEPEKQMVLFNDSGSESSGIVSMPPSKHDSFIEQGSEFEAPILSHLNQQVRPLLDAIDKLRLLNVMKEGIQLPTIVVVGDQSSGKSSVLESLAGVSLPRSQGICTRVPLVMRLQNHQSPTPQIYLEYNGKQVPVEEADIPTAINCATDEIAGNGKGIANTPLTLVVRRNGVPDLTMVDLPGITRVPVHGQPENIYEQIKDIIMEYITSEASIILNVLSATVDFSTCESIRMSQMVDKTGERTLAVVTKADRGSEGLAEKVNNDDINVGLGYVCVRNRIGEESYEEARREEANLFKNDLHLRKIDESIVGIPVLAKRLVEIQERILAKNLPQIMSNISTKLEENLKTMEKLPRALLNVTAVTTTLVRIVGATKESLKKLLLRGEFDEFPQDQEIHGTVHMSEMLNDFSKKLPEEIGSAGKFLEEEIKVLEEGKKIGLPNFLPHNAFLRILQRKVDVISSLPVKFAEKVWVYIDKVMISVLNHHAEIFYQLKSYAKRAAQKVVKKMRERSIEKVKEIVLMEKLTDYTSNPEYLTECTKIIGQFETFKSTLGALGLAGSVQIEGFGVVEVGHLMKETNQFDSLQQAFELKMRMKAYWRIVLRRLVDNMALHLQYSIHNLLNSDIHDIENETLEPEGIAMILKESPELSTKREKLLRSIKILKESEEIVSSTMVRIADFNDI